MDLSRKVLSNYNRDTLNFEPDMPIGEHLLVFRDAPSDELKTHACNLSGIAILTTQKEGQGKETWSLTASDERAAIIRSRWLPKEQCWGEADVHCLGKVLGDPQLIDGEADLEVTGLVRRADMSCDRNLLLAAGSCSAKRKKANPDEHDFETVLDRLGTKVRQPSKYFIALVSLDDTATPVAEHGGRRSVKLRRKDFRKLFKELSRDPHFCDYFDREGPTVPCKYGGFDIEGGFAFEVEGVSNCWDIYLGCRGPVFDQFAVILHLRVTLTENGTSLKLVPLHVQNGKEVHYRKIFVYSEGAGVRDLACDHAGSVYLLLGAMGNEPAVANVIEVPGFTAHLETSQIFHKGIPACLIGKDTVYGVLTLACPGFDKPEGMDFLRGSEGADGGRVVVITFDSPEGECCFRHYELRSR